MKKCLLLIPRMGNGGAERVMATIANNLCRDHEVRIITMTDDKCFYPLDGRVHITGIGQKINRKNAITKLLSSSVGGTKVLYNLIYIIKEWEPDVLLAFLGPASMLAVLIKLLSMKCRVIVSERYDPTARGKTYQWFERCFFLKVDAVVCQSKTAASFFSSKVRDKIVVIPNPISADAIPERHIGTRSRRIVGVGRLDHQKNFSMLISAFSRLPEQFYDYSLEIYGGGHLEMTLQKQICSLGLENRVKLMGIKAGVMNYIADAALFVMSSNYEGFPNALVEAMATGLPVISTDFATGVARELIGEKNGWLIRVGDEDALLASMIKALESEAYWEQMSIENRKVLSILSEERVMQQWKRIMFTDAESEDKE